MSMHLVEEVRLIDAYALKKRLIEHYNFVDDFDKVLAICAVDDQPTFDTAVTSHGHWTGEKEFLDVDENGVPSSSAWCSVCNEWLTASDEYPTIGKYCPNCGSKMDEKIGGQNES